MVISPSLPSEAGGEGWGEEVFIHPCVSVPFFRDCNSDGPKAPLSDSLPVRSSRGERGLTLSFNRTQRTRLLPLRLSKLGTLSFNSSTHGSADAELSQ